MSEVFLSSASWGLQELRNRITEYLEAKGIQVVRSESPGFYGSTTENRHDVCLRRVRDTSNYLLIIDRRAGSAYRGRNGQYRGLTVTHAEAKTAIEGEKRWDCFVRHEVWTCYQIWKYNHRGFWVRFDSIDREVFRLLDDIDRKEMLTCQLFDNDKDILSQLDGLSWVGT